jgi:hypothetical protein
MSEGEYDPAARAREKQAARDQDDRDLRSGAVSPAELKDRNSLVAGLDLSQSMVRRRRR